MTEPLQLTRHGAVAVITLANPPANTWSEQILQALALRVADLNSDASVRALVLTGAGPKFFSAGADLKQFADGDADAAARVARRFGEAFEALAAFRGVSIAAINGVAMGGGLEAALACDIRLAAPEAVLALPEAAVGLLPCAGGTQRLTALVGEGWAKRMILCGERIDAATALRIGLVEEVAAAGELLATAIRLGEGACRQAPSSIAACKQLIDAGSRSSWQANLAAEREAFVRLFAGHEAQEGVQAFLQKRSPAWREAQ